jgi:hypothetical protein
MLQKLTAHYEIVLQVGFSGLDIELDNSEKSAVSAVVMTTVDLDYGQEHNPSPDTIYIIYSYEITHLIGGLEVEIRLQDFIPSTARLEDLAGILDYSRVISTIDLEGGGLANISENAFYDLKSVLLRSSSILWLTKGGVWASVDITAAITTGVMRLLQSEIPESSCEVAHLQSTTAANPSRDIAK